MTAVLVVLGVIGVFVAAALPPLLLVRARRRPVPETRLATAAGSSTFPTGLHAVIPIAISMRTGLIELIVAEAGDIRPASWRLAGPCPSAGVVSALEGWCTSRTTVLLEVGIHEEATLYGPTAAIAGLHRCEALPLNMLDIGGVVFLRVRTRYGEDLHLAPQVGSLDVVRPRPASPAGRDRWEWAELAVYEPSLSAARWGPRTMCGLEWWQMASHAVEITLVARRQHYMCDACSGWAARRSTNPE